MANGIEGFEQVNRALENVPRGLLRNIIRIIDSNTLEMQRYIREEHLTGGTTATRLRVRTGRLKASVVRVKAVATDSRVDGGVTIGTKYARVHFGPMGQETTITPKRTKYLTIPLPAAMTKVGILRGPVTSEIFGETFVRKSKAGNLIIFGKLRYMKGKRMGELRSRIVPLFLLRKSVTIPARIHPEEILEHIRPKLIEDLREKGLEIR